MCFIVVIFEVEFVNLEEGIIVIVDCFVMVVVYYCVSFGVVQVFVLFIVFVCGFDWVVLMLYVLVDFDELEILGLICWVVCNKVVFV